jgi:DnaJ-domain-containing protein 1
MTAVIIYSGLIGIYGFIIGKSFKGLNPFLMLLGMVFSLPVIGAVEQHQQPLLYIPFAIGFITNFASPLRSVMDFFLGIKMDIERSRANKRYNKEQKQRQKEYDKQQAKYEKERAKQQSTQSHQRQTNSYSEQQKQTQAEQERLRRQAEELRRQREQFQREQTQAKNNQTNQNKQTSSNNDDLNPNNFKDACEILGCKDTDDKATIKKAYQRLSSMFHPDKVEKLGGRRKVQALAEMKLINQAWVRVQQKLGK